MTYGKEYTLADKLQKQFKNRGSDVSGMQASSTSELMRRAEMGRDPGVNCAEQAYRESYNRSRTDSQTRRSERQGTRAQQSTGRASDTASAYGASRGTRQSYGAGTSPHREQAHANVKSSAREHVYEVHHDRPAYDEGGEVRVKQKGLSLQFVALIIAGTVMLMILVLAVSDTYRTTREIDRLEAELQALQAEAADLRLQLEEKNDIRVIEEIATKDLGMVKEDSLQRRYISISDGEHIELLNTEEENEEKTGGVLLSSILSALGDLFGRFK